MWVKTSFVRTPLNSSRQPLIDTLDHRSLLPPQPGSKGKNATLPRCAATPAGHTLCLREVPLGLPGWL